jgi:transcriptional regulator with GAF, ATPase, and Fis domain
MLNDLQGMTEALMSEVVQSFAPETAALMLRRVEGFTTYASAGLSHTEKGMVVPDDHPLFAQLISSMEPVLISPVDLAQGLVAGIGGARTEALMAAPLEVDGRCIAIIIVGRRAFTPDDLESLDELAHEAAPGLAVAQLLDRLRNRA